MYQYIHHVQVCKYMLLLVHVHKKSLISTINGMYIRVHGMTCSYVYHVQSFVVHMHVRATVTTGMLCSTCMSFVVHVHVHVH